MAKHDVTVRSAESAEDAAHLLCLIERLAEFEDLAPPDAEAREWLVRDGFERTPPRFHALLADLGNETPCGYAIYFETYSTFLCRPTLYIEDIFVLPEHRRHGVGSAIMKRIVSEAATRGCGRIEWACLDWNKNAHHFYDNLGAKRLSQWHFYRLDRDAIDRLVAGEP